MRLTEGRGGTRRACVRAIATRAMIPFVLFLALLLVALVPWVPLFLPATFHLGG